jgi:hypothetical protein
MGRSQNRENLMGKHSYISSGFRYDRGAGAVALGALGSVMIMGAMGPRVGETSSDVGSPAAGGVGGVSGQVSSLHSSALGLDTITARNPHPTPMAQRYQHCVVAAGWVAHWGGDGGGARNRR